MRIRVWSDYTCPYCFVGHGLAERLKATFPAVAVTWEGFELHPEIPEEGVPFARLVPPAFVDRAQAFVTKVARAAGVSAPPHVPERVPNTRRAHAAAAWVRAHDATRFNAFHEAVFRAHWVKGEDIADADVLARVYADVDGDADALRAAVAGPLPDAPFRDAAESAYVSAVPTFDFLGERLKRRVVGAQPFDVVAGMAREVLQADAAAGAGSPASKGESS